VLVLAKAGSVRKPVACVSAVQASSHLTSGKKLSGALLRARRSQISRGSTTFTPQASGACRPRYCSAFVIASPDRERATGADLLQQSGADQLIDNLSGGFPFKVRRQFSSAIIALRSRGQNDELRIGESWHRDPPLRWCGVVCRHHHSPTVAFQPAGQDPEVLLAPGTVTLPLCPHANASPFWIILLLV
jgi:hypothetical protein